MPTLPELFRGTAAGLTVSAQVDHLLMAAVGWLCWLLTTWVALVTVLALALRVVGGTDARIVAMLRYLAPRAMRGVLISALGVGSVAALSACAPVATADSTNGAVTTLEAGPGGSTGSEIGFLSTDMPVSSTSTGMPTDGGYRIDLEWPVAPSTPVVETLLPPPAGPAPTSDTTPAVSVPASDPSTTDPAPVPGPTSSTTPAVGVPTPDPTTTDPAPVPGPATTPPATSAAVPPTAPMPAAPPPTTAPSAPPPAAAAAVVVVQPGDSLWSIAAAHLGPDPSDTAVAAAWPLWFEANRVLIGDDPDLIRPGWQLTVPTDSGASAS